MVHGEDGRKKREERSIIYYFERILLYPDPISFYS